MNTILGGSFSSRLNLNLREKNGYTYGACSGFDMRAAAGPFVCGGRRADRQDVRGAEGILQRAERDPEAGAGRRAARARRTTCRCASRRGFETTGDISRRLEDVLVYRLPDDYFSRYVQNIEAVTAADVQRVAQKYIQPDRFAVVVVGDRKVIEPGIRALNLGPIKVMTIDEVFK